MKPATCPFLDRERRVAQILRWVFLSLAAAGVVRCVMSPIATDKLLIIVGLMLCSAVLLYVYYYRLRYPFKQIGIETIQQLGAQLTPDQRDQLWSKNYMTLYRWDVVRRQASVKNSNQIIN